MHEEILPTKDATAFSEEGNESLRDTHAFFFFFFFCSQSYTQKWLVSASRFYT